MSSAIARTLLRHHRELLSSPLALLFISNAKHSVIPLDPFRNRGTFSYLRTLRISMIAASSSFGHKCDGNLFRKVITESGGDVSFSLCVCFHITSVRCNRSHICTQLFHISFATQFVCSSFHFDSVIALMDLALLYDLFFIVAKLILERRMAIKNSRQTPANELACWAIGGVKGSLDGCLFNGRNKSIHYTSAAQDSVRRCNHNFTSISFHASYTQRWCTAETGCSRYMQAAMWNEHNGADWDKLSLARGSSIKPEEFPKTFEKLFVVRNDFELSALVWPLDDQVFGWSCSASVKSGPWSATKDSSTPSLSNPTFGIHRRLLLFSGITEFLCRH